MGKIVGGHFFAFFLTTALCWPVYAINSLSCIWINPAYRGYFSKKDLNQPDFSVRFPRQQGSCGSYPCVVEYLRQNFQARNIQIEFTMAWDFRWDEVGALLSQAREDATGGDDYLEYCIIGESRSYSGMDGYALVGMTMTYVATDAEEIQVNQRVDEILTLLVTPDMNPEQREKVIHDWIVANVEFDTDPVKKYSAYAALFLGRSVCQGYALLAHKMLATSQIPVRIVHSDTMSHAWNMVNLCGSWYHIDLTWDDPLPDEPGRVLYTFFNLSDAGIDASHDGWRSAVPDAPEAPMDYEEGVCKKGDVNHRDGVDLQDAILVLQTLAGIQTDDVFVDADVNNDGRMGVADLLYILQMVSRMR